MNTSVKQGSVIVGVDGSAGGAVALEWAAHHASARHRPLVLVHGAGDPTASSRFVGTQEARHRLRHDAHLVTDHALGVVQTLAPTVDVQVTAPLHDARQVLLGSRTGPRSWWWGPVDGALSGRYCWDR